MSSAHFSPTPLLETIRAHRRGQPVGMYSICSANRHVIAACMQQALQEGTFLLLEATSNQVNQFGGYTGLDAFAFVEFTCQIAASVGLPLERLVLGGDHIGPNPWAGEAADIALEKARQLVQDYARAGFVKFHLDASMPLGGDAIPLDPARAAARAADLCMAVEEVTPDRSVYVIGSDVPPPGGALQSQSGVTLTRAEDVHRTIELHRRAFQERGLESAWERVVALVVDPGIEFGDNYVVDYNPEAARELARFIESQPHQVYEAHSTDYQTPTSLRRMVNDHFAILKVGPALTFAFREAVFALAAIQQEWQGESRLPAALEAAMLADSSHWRRYYRGDASRLALSRRYSYSDRIRYYWALPEVEQALNEMLSRLEQDPPPLNLLSQYLPVQYWKVRQGILEYCPLPLIYDKIREIVAQYAAACSE